MEGLLEQVSVDMQDTGWMRELGRRPVFNEYWLWKREVDPIYMLLLCEWLATDVHILPQFLGLPTFLSTPFPWDDLISQESNSSPVS